MPRPARMRCFALLGLALTCLPLAAAAVAPREPTRIAPGPGCLDARGLRDMNQTDADSVTVLAADYQALGDARTLKTMPTVQVAATSETRSRFGASPAYCFSARALRSWSEDPKGIQVETNPRRSGGNRYYRVELGTYCPEVTNAPEISFRSGFGNGLICGNPGDRMMASQAMPGDLRRQSNPRNYLGCAVMAVYPIR